MDERKLLFDGAYTLGISLSEIQIDQFMLYKILLLEWNQKMNLTAITEDFEVITKHFLDCLTINKALDMAQVKTLIDIGTGAGFPGLVIKIAFPHIKVTLVDSLKKRLTFLEEVIMQLRLEGVVCVHQRAEDLGKQKQYREAFDVCASRAVAHLAVLSEYTIPFVKLGGYLIALKGQRLDEELQQGKKALEILGATLEEIIDAAVPETDLNHRIAKIKKVKSTALKYPRKAGEPTKMPLGLNKL
ncbi:16S rRNA (guanine(527)-N(7))-methyltransferase RsmG [Cellulosilyticum sp. I15G10I2]|uniref:16S rRNA (guanine(527)-N(7))-methyltransferase RsmG n=1 Tax=Cellulosilyticum sp. I15G10I2 TaxID=1892843 RepID=UPI00085BB5AC|nr:16S rRNA (guanine(527)-N(7))-methyltransferase RsmG [Cellulosilyticum sp. I15G10I2]